MHNVSMSFQEKTMTQKLALTEHAKAKIGECTNVVWQSHGMHLKIGRLFGARSGCCSGRGVCAVGSVTSTSVGSVTAAPTAPSDPTPV